MSNTATIEHNEAHSAEPIIKTPGTRLLDLLAGWGRFVESDEAGDEEQAPIVDAGLDGYEIAGMYQDAAAEVIELQGEAETEAVRRWVIEKILPALIRSAHKPAIVDTVSVTA